MFRNLLTWLILVVTAATGSRHTSTHTAQYDHANTSKNEQLDYMYNENNTRIHHRIEEIQLPHTSEGGNSVKANLDVENPLDGDDTESEGNPPIGNTSDKNLSGDIAPGENSPGETAREDNFPVETEPEENSPVESEPEENPPKNEITPEENPTEKSTTECMIEMETKGGLVRGYELQRDPPICAYVDIPYGKIEGRFQAPLEADPWLEAHEKREHNKACPQILASNEVKKIGDENCLVVSVFTPKEVKDAPVLFYIHDGNFQDGSGDPAMFGPENIVAKGVILVLPNYRLGPLGFLCLRNSMAPGNAALKDLTLALKWVYDNIQKFGGDPTKITVSGDGKAGALVSLLALSPLSRNLFTKAITESGSMLSPWAIDRDPVEKGMALEKLLCEDGDECETPYEVLEKVSLSTLLTTSFKHGFHFVPCIEANADEAFLREAPWRLLKSNIINTTFLVGTADRSGMHESLEHDSETLDQLNKNRESLLPVDLVFDDSKIKTEVTNDITTLYFDDEDISEERKEELTKYYTDALYLGPSVRMARALLAAGATVYLYEFSYVGSLNRERNTLSAPGEGAARGDLSGYLFAQEGMTLNENDENVMNLIMDLWISFMRTGEPNSCAVRWNALAEAGAVQESWLLIAAQATSQRGLHATRLELWTRLYRNHYIDNNESNIICPGYSLLLMLFVQILLRIIKYYEW